MPMPDPLPESERAAVGPAVVGSPGTIVDDPTLDRPPKATTPRTCPICGVGLRGRRTSACSDKHRAAKSRRRRIAVTVEAFRSLLTREQIKVLAKEAGLRAEDFA